LPSKLDAPSGVPNHIFPSGATASASTAASSGIESVIVMVARSMTATLPAPAPVPTNIRWSFGSAAILVGDVTGILATG